MLPQTTNPLPIVLARNNQPTKRRASKKIIDSRDQPVTLDPDLSLEIERLMARDDIRSLAALYDAFVSMTDVANSVANEPRAGEAEKYLDELQACLVAKALLVADHMQKIRPTLLQEHDLCRVLFDCAMRMGATTADAIAVTQTALSRVVR